jgi:hypothetical protein
MVGKAAGGGAVMAFTTLVKFGLYALALSAFWGGFLAGVNYAAELCADPVAAFHRGHQAARHDGTGHGRQAQGAGLRRAPCSPLWTRSRTWCARRWRPCWATCWWCTPGVLLAAGAGSWPGHTASSARTRPLHVLDSLHLLGPRCCLRPSPGCCCLRPASSPGGRKTGSCCTAWTRPCATTRASRRWLGMRAGRALGALSAREHLGLCGQHLAGLHAGPDACGAGFSAWGWMCAT